MSATEAPVPSASHRRLVRLAGLPLVWLLSALVMAYRLFVSPLLPPSCRYAPTCSAYALEALRAHGPLKGGWLSARRIARCHPWGGSGYDPVPPSVPLATGSRGPRTADRCLTDHATSAHRSR